MSSARVWKSLASVVGASGLLLTAAGLAGASGAPGAFQPSEQKDPPINCATAEHAGFGAAWHAFNECPGDANAVDGR
jgi:hypothetical protein